MSAVAWIDAAAQLPDEELLVLIAVDDDVLPGFVEGGVWYYTDAMPITQERVTHWMRMPPGPGTADRVPA